MTVRRRGRCVVRDASFEIPDGAIAGVVASEPATAALFATFAGEVPPREGTLTVGGSTISPPRRGFGRRRSPDHSGPRVERHCFDEVGVTLDTTTRQSRVVLIDGAFDPRHGDWLGNVVRRLPSRGATVVIAAKQLVWLTSCCDWLVVVEAGIVTYSGTTSAFRGRRDDQ